MSSMSYHYLLGLTTVSNIISETYGALWHVLSPVVLSPCGEEQWNEIARTFEEKCQFPHCIGALDGKHVIVQAPKYQNNYRLQPYNPFNSDVVDKIVKQVMMNRLEDAIYDDKEAAKLCCEVSADIRNRIQKCNFDRYKIVVLVTICEKASQAIQASMRFIWDHQKDNYSSFTFETRTFYAYCLVFGIYYE